MSFEFRRLQIPDVVLIHAQEFADHRGFFTELYKRSEFQANGIPHRFVQDNYSHSLRGVLRGLHYQLEPKAQGKLVSVIRGEIFDVAVDIRRGSPTYARWVGMRMSSAEHVMVYVPTGFAHGFQVLSDEADVVYKVTEEYSFEADWGIIWNDPDIGITWPLPDPVLSSKDAALPVLSQAKNHFVFQDTSD